MLAPLPSHADTLIIGIGNQFRGDDAFGLTVIQHLRDSLPEPVDLREFEGDGVALMQQWQGYQTVIIVDCVISGAPPGTLFRLNPAESAMPAHFFRSSSHLFGVAEAIEMARTLGQLPVRLLVFGVEGSEFAVGSSMSPAVAASVNTIAGQIQHELKV